MKTRMVLWEELLLLVMGMIIGTFAGLLWAGDPAPPPPSSEVCIAAILLEGGTTSTSPMECSP